MIYELWDLIKNQPFYVGWTDTLTKGKNRPLEHLKEEARAGKTITKGNRLKLNIIRKLRKMGMPAEIREVAFYDDFDISLQAEIDLIAKWGRRDLLRGPLSNMTDGGQGTLGIKDSDATRKKKAKGRIGKLHTASAKQLIKEARKHQKPSVWTNAAKLKQSKQTHLRQNAGKTYEELYGNDKASEMKHELSMTLRGRRSDPTLEKKRIIAHKKCWILKMENKYRAIFELLDAGSTARNIINTIGVSADTVRKAKSERNEIERILNENS